MRVVHFKNNSGCICLTMCVDFIRADICYGKDIYLYLPNTERIFIGEYDSLDECRFLINSFAKFMSSIDIEFYF